MKTKVLLIVLLIGIVGLVVYGRRRPLTPDEEDARQRQIFEQGQILRQQRLEHYSESRQRKFEQEDEKKRQKKQDNHSQRIKLLEERVIHLEHALTTELSHLGVLPDMQGAFDAEIIRRSNESMAEIQRAVRGRVLKMVKPLSDESGQ